MCLFASISVIRYSYFVDSLKRKGFYIKKGKDGSLYFNFFVADFVAYLSDLKGQDGWATLRLYERENKDDKGHTHNLEPVQMVDKEKVAE